MGGLVEEALLADGDGGRDLGLDKGSDFVLKLGKFWLISGSGKGLMELEFLSQTLTLHRRPSVWKSRKRGEECTLECPSSSVHQRVLLLLTVGSWTVLNDPRLSSVS